METKAKETTVIFSPAIPLPKPFDVKQRIQELRGYLDPKDPFYQPKQQHTNIKAAIKLYEDGKIDGVEEVFIKDGKLVPEEETFKGGSWSWNEGVCHQYAQKHADDHGTFGTSYHEASISLFDAQYLQFFLQIHMLLRLIPELGGDGTTYPISVLNDTGSGIMTIFDTDMLRLGNKQGYSGYLSPTTITDANSASEE
jgi:hypothetical protein